MKITRNNFYFYILAIVFYCQGVNSQDLLSESEKYTATAKVWGFLKYYHPNVAEGNYNWDEQLFEILSKLKTISTKDELSLTYLEWIAGLGEVKTCKRCDSDNGSQYFDKNFNLEWINNDRIFTENLSKKLRHIERNRHQGEKNYVAYYSKKLKIANFTNEIDYSDFDWQDENLRLLSLFRYWNMVEYFFPYKYQTDTAWNEVLQTMVPKFLKPKSEQDFNLSLLELVVSIDDSHAFLRTKITNDYFGIYYIPVKYKLIEGKAIITEIFNDSLAKLDDIQIGDIVTKVNGQKIEDIFNKNEKYINGSNINRKKFNAYYSIFNGSSDSVELEFTRFEKTYSKIVKRYVFKDFDYKTNDDNQKDSYKILEGNIGYIDVSALKNIGVPVVMEALKSTKAIIFDTRKTSVAPMRFFGHYITSPRKYFYKVLVPDLDYPGKFYWEKGDDVGFNKKLQYEGEVVLLVDEGCQSQCEFTVMCLQTGNNATTIGSQTSGSDGNVSRFNMVGGIKTQITGLGIFYPDGTETQRKGVKIDIIVKPSIEGVVNGKDEILQQAIKFINK